MPNGQPETAPPTAAPSLPDYRWLPTVGVLPGMTLARPLLGHAGGVETMYVAEGSPITAHTIAQMVVKGVECVAVVVDDATQPDGHAPAVLPAPQAEAFERRLVEIFGAEPDPPCQALMDALRRARPVL